MVASGADAQCKGPCEAVLCKHRLLGDRGPLVWLCGQAEAAEQDLGPRAETVRSTTHSGTLSVTIQGREDQTERFPELFSKEQMSDICNNLCLGWEVVRRPRLL